MNKNIFLLAPLLLLLACAQHEPVQPVSKAPVCEELPIEVTEKLPPLEDITDPTMEGLVLEIIKLTTRLKTSENKLDTSVQMYKKCRQLAIDYNAQNEKIAK